MVAVGLAVANRSASDPWPQIGFVVVCVGYALLGALIASREPQNPIGWLFLAIGLFELISQGLALQYAIYALVIDPTGLPVASAALWLGSQAFDSVFVLAITLLLLWFPDGRPLTRRWGVAVWAAVVGAVFGSAHAFAAFQLDPPLGAFQNPFVATGTIGSIVGWLYNVSGALSVSAFFAGIASSIVRFHRSSGTQRVQLKWFAAAIATLLMVVVLLIVINLAWNRDFGNAMFIPAFTLIPAATGVAMLRYRLYEIDVIIRKTLVYATLAVILALFYLGAISLMSWAFRSLTGQSSALAVTVSTLAVAAAFQPLRSRIQRVVDHRFYRNKYDANRTLEAFNGRLREQIDLDVLHTEVLGVVTETLRPSHATLWLRPTEPRGEPGHLFHDQPGREREFVDAVTVTEDEKATEGWRR